MSTVFTRLNSGWNAEPNAPEPYITRDGSTLLLGFYLNAFQYPQLNEEDKGILRFHGCSRYRLGATNDEGWYLGQCRFSRVAPAWGEFYELTGDLLLDRAPNDWVVLSEPTGGTRHFLFYLRDNTFECNAEAWSFSVLQGSTLNP